MNDEPQGRPEDHTIEETHDVPGTGPQADPLVTELHKIEHDLEARREKPRTAPQSQHGRALGYDVQGILDEHGLDR